MVNWIAAFNHLFDLLDRKGTPTYSSGPDFLRTAQAVEKGVPSYDQMISLRTSQGKSTSRKAFYWDVLHSFDEQQKYQLFRLFIDRLEPHAKDEVDALRAIVFGGGQAVPQVTVPIDLWSSEMLNRSLKEIDQAIDARQYNRAGTLAYTCLEGLYKTYLKKHVPDKASAIELMILCKAVKDDISEKLKAKGPYPVEIVNAMPTLTHAVANARNGFSDSHFADDSEKWLAHFARDLTNSIGRLLLHFV
jgi:hypothetical protein